MKAMTTADFFRKIIDSLSLKPEGCIEYVSASNVEAKRIILDLFDVGFMVDLGGCEGTYLTVYAIGDIGENNVGKYKLGTVKSLNTDKEAVKTLSLLGAEIMHEANMYIRKHPMEFRWVGFSSYAYADGFFEDSKDDSAGIPLFWHPTRESAEKAAKEWLQNNTICAKRVEIIDLSTKTVSLSLEA